MSKKLRRSVVRVPAITARERLEQFLTDMKIGFKSEGHSVKIGDIGVDEHTHEIDWDSKRNRRIYSDYPHDVGLKLVGYSGFYCEFEFDDEGNLTHYGCWE